MVVQKNKNYLQACHLIQISVEKFDKKAIWRKNVKKQNGK